MKKVQLSPNLWLHEYIPKEMYLDYEKKGKLHHLRWMIDDRLINADQALRDRFGSLTINNWASHGSRKWSGLRTPGSPYYKEASSHSFGRASDKIFSSATAEEVRDEIKKNQAYWKLQGITAIEDGVSWVHSDCRPNNSDEILIFNP